ncbi:hypothetical protein R0137_10975 [Congregibacter brevis]|uniref:Uncharacterized protein n=1 Tax=Congregibacter brevis TaxID=3081201 RepID=A0ABZ0IB36_9GAMM|nr:hypothetical protein R0137_10975 [Congregibacter sp. IMCC45268]
MAIVKFKEDQPIKAMNRVRNLAAGAHAAVGTSNLAPVRTVLSYVDYSVDAVQAALELAETPDPNKSPDGHKAYVGSLAKREYEKSRSRAADLKEMLKKEKKELADEAYKLAGLAEQLPHAEAQEIRAASRALSQKERDKMIASAFERRDGAVVRALIQSPSEILFGPVTVPLNGMVARFIDQAVPSYPHLRGEVERAEEVLDLTANAVAKQLRELRSHAAEERVDATTSRVAAAEAVLASGPAPHSEVSTGDAA